MTKLASDWRDTNALFRASGMEALNMEEDFTSAKDTYMKGYEEEHQKYNEASGRVRQQLAGLLDDSAMKFINMLDELQLHLCKRRRFALQVSHKASYDNALKRYNENLQIQTEQKMTEQKVTEQASQQPSPDSGSQTQYQQQQYQQHSQQQSGHCQDIRGGCSTCHHMVQG